MKIKTVIIIFWLFTLLLFIASCNTLNNTSNYTAENVIAIAKKNSPECRKQQVDPSCNCSKNLYDEAEPVYTAEFLGNGKWKVNKACSINQDWNRYWYFYENTGDLVVRSASEIGTTENSSFNNTSIPGNIAEPPKVGMKAPDFTLNNIEGKSVKLSNYQGKYILLDFWVYSCPGCREKVGIIQEAFNKLPAGKYTVLCINVREREALIRTFASSEKINIPILLDSEGKVTELYGVTGFPTTFFIDTDRIIRKIDLMFENTEELVKMINDLSSDAKR